MDQNNEINNFTLHNLLNKTSKDEAQTGITKFRCIFVKNTHTSDAILNPILTIPQNTISGNDEVALGWDPSGINSPAQTIADENDYPDNVTFIAAQDRANGAVLGQNIPPNGTKPFWIRLSSTFGAEGMLTNGLVIRLLADNLVTSVIDQAPTPSPESSFCIMGETDLNDDLNTICEEIKHRNTNFCICTGNNFNNDTSQNADDWFNTLGPSLARIMRLCLGRNDMTSDAQINQYLNKYGLKKKFHAFTYENCHFVFMDTASGPDAYSQASEQYEFIVNDLKSANADSTIDWIFVVMNRAMYATQTNTTTKYVLKSLRDVYHPLFEKYGVHCVLNGDFKNYQRQHVLHFNGSNSDLPEPILTGDQLAGIYKIKKGHNAFQDVTGNSGCLFITCGVGGAGHDNVVTPPNFYTPIFDSAHFGYLLTQLKNNVKKFFDENDPLSEIIEEYHELIISFYDELQENLLDQCVIRKTLQRNVCARSIRRWSRGAIEKKSIRRYNLA